MATTAIEWTEVTWNPTTGCDRVSPGCDHCYALTLAKRLKGMGQAKYQRDGDPRTSGPGFGLTTHHDVLSLPLSWRKPRRVFVNSMSDLFHDEVPVEFIAKVFAVMAATPQHTYQVLTKRHGRMRSLLNSYRFRESVFLASNLPHGDVLDRWPLPNVWAGVSVEDQKWADIRIPALLETPAAVRWISAEPLLGPVDLTWCGGVNALDRDWIGGPGGGMGAPHPFVDWVVVGGESGPGARPMDEAWARSLVEQCRSAGVAPFVKQLGSVWARAQGQPVSRVDPKGGDPHWWPADLRVREYPDLPQDQKITEE